MARDNVVDLTPQLERLANMTVEPHHGGSGGGGGMDEVVQRVKVLEADMKDVKAVLARLEPVLSGIDSRLKSMQSDAQKQALDVAELKGRVSQLPSTVQLIGFVLAVLIAGGVLRYIMP